MSAAGGSVAVASSAEVRSGDGVVVGEGVAVAVDTGPDSVGVPVCCGCLGGSNITMAAVLSSSPSLFKRRTESQGALGLMPDTRRAERLLVRWAVRRGFAVFP